MLKSMKFPTWVEKLGRLWFMIHSKFWLGAVHDPMMNWLRRFPDQIQELNRILICAPIKKILKFESKVKSLLDVCTDWENSWIRVKIEGTFDLGVDCEIFLIKAKNRMDSWLCIDWGNSWITFRIKTTFDLGNFLDQSQESNRLLICALSGKVPESQSKSHKFSICESIRIFS